MRNFKTEFQCHFFVNQFGKEFFVCFEATCGSDVLRNNQK